MAVGALAALVAAIATGIVLSRYGVPLTDQARFWAAVAGTVVLPGAIVLRTRRMGSVPGWLGAAFTVGLAFQLLGWAVGVGTGQRWLLWVVPVVVALLVAAALRVLDSRRGAPRRLREPRAERPERAGTPWWASLVLLGVWLGILRSLSRGLWAATPLDYSRRWYQDMDWQLSLSAEALHRVALSDPQSSQDGYLSYHWFGNAHAAALSITSGLGVDQVGIVAWFVPVMIALLFLVYGMARALSGSPAAGALAALFVVLPPALPLNVPLDQIASVPLVWLSQSHIFSLPVAVLLTWLLIDVLRAREVPTLDEVLLLLVALVATGAKVSILPTVLGGAGIAALFVLRRPRLLVRSIILGVIGCALVLITMPMFSGGGGGTTYSLLPAGGAAGPLGVWIVAVIVVVGASAFLPFLLSAGAVGTLKDDDGGRRIDPAVPVFAGMVIVALAALFVMKHPSLSQTYFMRGILPVAAVFMAWGVVATASRAVRLAGPLARTGLIAGGLLGFIGVCVYRGMTLFTDRKPAPGQLIGLTVAVILLALLIVALRAARGRAGALVSVVVAGAVLGGSLVYPALSVGLRFAGLAPAGPVSPGAGTPLIGTVPPLVKGGGQSKEPATAPLTKDEVAGGTFLAQANPDGELIATNVHCMDLATRPNCDARGFWVASLTESPVDIGGWVYSASGRASHGKNGIHYYRQPYVDAEAFRLNQEVFTAPSEAGVQRLRDRGVRFLYADKRASAVSPELARFAERVWSSPTVEVYRIR
ncbi:hypothetical protein [Falsarthrobacter nasiphocae]|uniref:Uncharacterized protein n=1 Tax=Falsarthrobacter nasiphocae TaxID=189863 RepID=A0AAE4C514_9MICC|nr:hypothetical protein [Falsarthrobacter nasiphocae]MDR6891876.1 hypothetical protein [Falsarthrobacter nasiphocae]